MVDSPREALQRLAVLVNKLPEEDREKLTAALSVYTHDFKHTLGLVTGASALISRTASDQPQIGEMTDIIKSASSQLDDLINLMVEELNNRINTGR